MPTGSNTASKRCQYRAISPGQTRPPHLAPKHGTPDQAFERLVDQSQRTNVKLHTIAQQFVDRVCRPATDGQNPAQEPNSG